jgi:spore photoproduct lyase
VESPVNFKIKKTILEKGAEDYSLANKVREQFQDGCLLREDQADQVSGLEGSDPDKETLRLVSFPGQLLKPCPGTREYLCCGYQILHIGTNCPLDCSYCILQAYFNQPSLRVFVNVERQLESIGEAFQAAGTRIFRIGTGEFTDSLALDPVVKWTEFLPPFVAKQKNVVLEFKTKTLSVEGLLSSPYRERIVVSWSLNSRFIAAREEHGAPSIKKRLEAARSCQREGYTLGFHFDPLIEHPSWKEEYARTVDLLDHFIDASKIIWISLGCLRYMPPLKKVIRRRFPETHILDGEFIPGLDGKMRYIKPVRIEMCGFMKEKLAQYGIRSGVYLCMESSDVWLKALGWSPGTSKELSCYLDDRAIKVFGLPPFGASPSIRRGHSLASPQPDTPS